MYLKLAVIVTLVYIHLTRSNDGESIDENRVLNIESGIDKLKEVFSTVNVGGSNPLESNPLPNEQISPPASGEGFDSHHNNGVENGWSTGNIFNPNEGPLSPSQICHVCPCTYDDHNNDYECTSNS